MNQRKNLIRFLGLSLVIAIVFLANFVWVFAKSQTISEDSSIVAAENRFQASRGEQILYTPSVRTFGFFECTVVNVSDQHVDATVEILFLINPSRNIGPIGGPLGHGGTWIANQAGPAGDFARGVVKVNGDKRSVRASCISTNSSTSSNGVVVIAE